MLNIEYRDYTDVGFKTTFALVSDQAPALSEDFDSRQANVYADHPHTPAGAGVSLQTEKGSIKSLNGYVFCWQMANRGVGISSVTTQLFVN